MKPNRNYITPFISLLFLVVGLSGLLMLFHWFDGYTEVVHEVLGLFFVVCAFFHILLNWKPLKMHFSKGVFWPALMGVLAISALLVTTEIMYPPVDILLMERIAKAPIPEAFKALNIDPVEANRRLSKNGINAKLARKLEDLWLQGRHDPEKIIDLLLEESASLKE